MNLVKTIAFSAILFFAFGFKGATKPDFIGTYGISKNDPAKLELRINANNTFYYTDLLDPAKKVEVSGNWEAKDNIIILKNYSSEFPYASKWKIEKTGRAIKCIKGTAVYRLARL